MEPTHETGTDEPKQEQMPTVMDGKMEGWREDSVQLEADMCEEAPESKIHSIPGSWVVREFMASIKAS